MGTPREIRTSETSPADPSLQPRERAPCRTAAQDGLAVFNDATFSTLVSLLSRGAMQPHLQTLHRLLECALSSEASPAEVRTVAHKLVSQAGSLGFEQICSCSRDVENAPHHGGVAKQVGALHQAARAAAPTLDRLLAHQRLAGMEQVVATDDPR